MARKKKSNRKFSGVDPAYLDKQRDSLRRIHRKTVLFNAQELAAIDTYCKRFKVSSRSALIRQAVMEQVLSGLEENHPKLF
ncbi:MAG: hypothetical protein IKX62_05205 [Bacteroidales bacterium]|nr:hypothetical protein [Bacteroidales bacterium]